jgi:hypothetical protein
MKFFIILVLFFLKIGVSEAQNSYIKPGKYSSNCNSQDESSGITVRVYPKKLSEDIQRIDFFSSGLDLVSMMPLVENSGCVYGTSCFYAEGSTIFSECSAIHKISFWLKLEDLQGSLAVLLHSYAGPVGCSINSSDYAILDKCS